MAHPVWRRSWAGAAIALATATSLPAQLPPAPSHPAQPPPAVPGGINVTPLRIELKQDQQSARILLRNDTDRRMGVMLRVFAWTQDDAGDQYQPTDDIALSPSIVQVDPGLTQTFSVMASTIAPSGRERAYRVVIDQLPRNEQPAPAGPQTRLRLTLPLFTGTSIASPASLQFAASPDTLTIANTGGRSAKLADLTIRRGSASIPLPEGRSPHYVLGGATVHLSVPGGLPCGGPDIRLTGMLDQKLFDAAVPNPCS